MLAEQHGGWAEGRHYLGLDVLARAQAVDINAEEVTDELALQAITGLIHDHEGSDLVHHLTGLDRRPFSV